jgi:hypothetical protein
MSFSPDLRQMVASPFEFAQIDTIPGVAGCNFVDGLRINWVALLIERTTEAVRSLAGERCWVDLLAMFESEQSGEALLEMSATLDQCGDQFLQAQAYADALMCFQLGQWPAQFGDSVPLPERHVRAYYVKVYEMTMKRQRAVEQGGGRPEFLNAVADLAVMLVRNGRVAQAEQLAALLAVQ